MDIIELGAIGELVGGIGSAVGGIAVIASLIYVGLQIRQNTQVTRVQALSTRFSFQLGSDAFLFDDGAEAFVKAYERPAELNSAEILKISAYLYNAVSGIQTSFEAFEQGLSTRVEWETARGVAPVYLGFPFGLAWWQEVKSASFPETFIAEVDEALRAAGPSASFVHQCDQMKVAAQQMTAEG